MVLFSFLASLALFIGIGLASSSQKQNTASDYLLASQNIPPWLAGLSAIATYNSGFMFIGQIGYAYLFGLSSIWLLLGYIGGDYIATLAVHRRLQQVASQSGSLSYVETLANWINDGPMLWFRRIGGLIVVLLLGGYAAAQFAAGSKALLVLFGWPPAIGMVLGSIIVLVYCLAGGIRASIWTDAAQSVVMLSAMVLMAFVGIQATGGWGDFIHQLHGVSPTYMAWFKPATQQWASQLGSLGGILAPGLFIMGWVFGGAGVLGQPQVMVRFMTLANDKDIPRTRLYYYSWYTVFYVMTLLVAMTARLHLPDVATFDAELALPLLSQQLLPSVGTGLVLAGLFAATMSTADSIILVCSAALTKDVFNLQSNSQWWPKVATVAVTGIALLIALNASANVFDLVILSAGTLATVFAPIIIVLACNQRVTQAQCFAMMLIGVAIHLGWRFSPLGSLCFEIFPGMMAGLTTYYATRPWLGKRTKA